MNYHHFGHLDSFEPGMKVGLKFKRGDILGRVGKTGTTSPHLHYECMRGKPSRWTQYVKGMTKEQVHERYVDPVEYLSNVENLPMKWDHFGYKYLDDIGYGWHPGCDLNFGTGSQDLRMEARATCDGTIVYVGTDASNPGWGNHLWWKEESDMAQIYDNHFIQETQESGSFALVTGGKKHVVTPDRSGLAALTVFARKMEFAALTKTEWDAIQSGDNF